MQAGINGHKQLGAKQEYLSNKTASIGNETTTEQQVFQIIFNLTERSVIL